MAAGENNVHTHTQKKKIPAKRRMTEKQKTKDRRDSSKTEGTRETPVSRSRFVIHGTGKEKRGGRISQEREREREGDGRTRKTI